MNIRQSVHKTFNGCTVNKAVVYFGMPVCIQLHGDISSSYFVSSDGLGIERKPLVELECNKSKQEYIEAAKVMFSGVNPMTNEKDLSGEEFYAERVPLGVAGGIITPQTGSSGVSLFNGEGTITVAEVLDGINSIYYSTGSDDHREVSIDNISTPSDYFNEGYNLLCTGYSSPFYSLYLRSELVSPITRLELAYMLVVCSGIFGGIFTEKYRMGVSFDWLRPYSAVSEYVDWANYKVSLVSDDGRPSTNIKEYKGSRHMSDYIEDMKAGISAIPLPMLMSLVELGLQGLFYFEGNELCPLRQVTRGEVCYLLTNLAGKEIS